MSRYWTTTVDVDVDVDLDEVLGELDDDELAAHGLMRVPEGMKPPTSKARAGGHDHDLCSPWLGEHLDAVRRVRAAS